MSVLVKFNQINRIMELLSAFAILLLPISYIIISSNSYEKKTKLAIENIEKARQKFKTLEEKNNKLQLENRKLTDENDLLMLAMYEHGLKVRGREKE